MLPSRAAGGVGGGPLGAMGPLVGLRPPLPLTPGASEGSGAIASSTPSWGVYVSGERREGGAAGPEHSVRLDLRLWFIMVPPRATRHSWEMSQ